jgi:septal ring factor EnvC (AmiA/AmiB activator)
MASRRGGSGEQFVIEGLSQFQRELKKLSGALPTSLRKLNEEAANKIVDTGREKARRPQQAKAAESLRASRSANYVAVLLGDSSKYEFALGSEFGARRYKQFPPWRGNQWQSWGGGPGYFLHPAIREVGTTILDDYWDSIRGLARRAFPD